jgi:hypothetical protein
MSLKATFIDGRSLAANGFEVFRCEDPARREVLPDEFPMRGWVNRLSEEIDSSRLLPR